MPFEFTVTLAVQALILTDENLERLFAVLPDCVPSSIAGLVTVTAQVVADDGEGAAFTLIETIATTFPNATPLRLDQDLVAISDIANRTGRSRESIRLLVDSKRGPGGFPSPVGTVGDSIRVWPWASVIAWFSDRLGEDLGERGIDPETAAIVDARLVQQRASAMAVVD